MKVVRTFHPVGQGAFYSERFYDGTQLNATHNIVFDCGVSFGNEWKVAHVVNQAFTNDDVIDYLFISHLDYDHVSLVKTLISQVKRVENIILPLVSEEQLIIAMANYRILGIDGMALFFQEILNRKNRGVEVPTVHFVGEKDQSEIENADIWESGTVMPVSWIPEWVFIPYNVEFRSRRKELIKELGNVLKDPVFSNAINQMGWVPIENEKELFEKLKEEDFAEKILTIPVLRRAIRRAYASIEGDVNENSLLLYSGPVRQEPVKGCYRIEDCISCNPLCRCAYHRAGCLYTGDSTCNMADWKNRFAEEWGFIGTIQLPHHGSVESFDVSTNAFDRPYIIPVSFGNSNTYGHPSGKVLAYLMANDCCIQMVTEMANSVYIQAIGRRKV